MDSSSSWRDDRGGRSVEPPQHHFNAGNRVNALPALKIFS
jgi:hypothetical protein